MGISAVGSVGREGRISVVLLQKLEFTQRKVILLHSCSAPRAGGGLLSPLLSPSTLHGAGSPSGAPLPRGWLVGSRSRAALFVSTGLMGRFFEQLGKKKSPTCSKIQRQQPA